jgi:ABC-2 type transport system ATP-binding protein
MEVSLRGVGKTYDGEAWAVRGVDLDIPSGSIFGFIGPNGAGKSTTLRMVATVMKPTAGTISLDGERLTDEVQDVRRRIGFLGDGNPLYPDMSPAEYLRFFGQCYSLRGPELEQAIDDTLAELDLEGKRDEPCGSLSKGMRQRVLIGRCLLHRPELLILDEPADGLDPRGRTDLRRTLQRIHGRGVTILVSSHILRELDDLCDQVAIIQKGRLVVSGGVDNLIEGHEINRLVYDIQMLSGEDRAKEILVARQALIEHTGVQEGIKLIRAQIRGGDEAVADLVSEFVQAGVRLVGINRQRSRLEDVYDRLSEDRVN